MQYFDNVGAVFGNYQMSFEHFGFRNCDRLREDNEPEFKKSTQSAEKKLPVLTGRDRLHDPHQRRSDRRQFFGMNDLVNIQLVNDNLKQLDESWVN